jgi:hypothetical protein
MADLPTDSLQRIAEARRTAETELKKSYFCRDKNT